MTSKPISVVETPEFLSATRKLLIEEERTVLVDYLAYNPAAGDVVPGTGGVRKLRWALEGRGKSDLLLSQCWHAFICANCPCQE
jgi:hypothetical protein